VEDGVIHNPTAATAFWTDEIYDRDYASDGVSRYGAYLYSRAHLFADLDDDGPTSDAPTFAAVAFDIASSPVMAPGYVCHHSRVRHVSWCWDEDHRLAFEVQVVAPLPALIEKATSGRWAGWKRDRSWSGDTWWEPFDNDRPGAFTVVTVRVPLPVDLLPAPYYTARGVPDLSTAKLAVTAVCGQLNTHLAAILAALEGGGSR
jgi:hypothetical protein